MSVNPDVPAALLMVGWVMVGGSAVRGGQRESERKRDREEPAALMNANKVESTAREEHPFPRLPLFHASAVWWDDRTSPVSEVTVTQYESKIGGRYARVRVTVGQG